MTADTTPMANVAPVNLPGWTSLRDLTAPMLCLGCDCVHDQGFLHLTDTYAIHFLCIDCATDVLNVYLASYSETVIRQPSGGDIALQVFFAPKGDPKLAEVIVTPEPPTAEAMIDVVEAAAIRLADYVTEYSRALREDEPAVERCDG